MKSKAKGQKPRAKTPVVRAKRPSFRVGLLVNPDKPMAARIIPELVQWLKAEGHRPFVATRNARALKVGIDCCPADELVGKVDLVVALGGDGTLLRAARLVGRREVPIMGVNLGGLGFLTEFSADEAQEGITSFTRGRHQEESRMVLECRYGRRTAFVLNDCAVNMGPATRAIEVTAHADGVLATKFAGDGVIVATPTGSTAYSLAAGGPVVFPTMNAILLTPICPHALGSRPLILPGDAHVELAISPRSQAAVLNLDGQDRLRIEPGKPVRIRRADFSVRLVTPRGKTYFQILRDKLKWTGSQR